MGKKSSGTLLEEAVSTAVVLKGSQPWYRRVAPEHQAELQQARADWKAGKINLPLRVFARSLSRVLRSRGISTVGEQGVETWLRND